MNRPVIIGVIGAVIVAVAIAITFFIERRPGDEQVAVKPPREAVTAPVAPPSKPAEAAKLKAPAIALKPLRPSFDVVRVNPRGDTVIAGSAAPHAEVTVTDQKREIGKVKADSRGEWVLVPEKSLSSGPHELSLSARETKKAPQVLSKEKVILVVPKRGRDIAGRETASPSGALVLAVPRDESGGTTVLQKPGAPPSKPRVVSRTAEDLARAETRAATAEERRAAVAVVPAAGGAKPVPGAPRSDDGPKVGGANSSGAVARVPAARGPADRDLSMDSVDYDDAGRLSMSGKAPEGSRVQVYLDNKPVGDTTAGGTGAWRVEPSDTVAPGLYKLRVDQVDDRGKVAARLELPFSRAKPLAGLPRDSVVFVQPGTSLWRIARQTYGRGVRYAVIYEANRDQIGDPDLIYPGQIFYLPKVN